MTDRDRYRKLDRMADSLNSIGPPRGEAHVNAKLNEGLVRKIRQLHDQGFGYGRIATALSVSRATIERVIKRKAWAHVK